METATTTAETAVVLATNLLSIEHFLAINR